MKHQDDLSRMSREEYDARDRKRKHLGKLRGSGPVKKPDRQQVAKHKTLRSKRHSSSEER